MKRSRIRCFELDVDGAKVRVRGDRSRMTERDLEALRELARTAQRQDELEIQSYTSDGNTRSNDP